MISSLAASQAVASAFFDLWNRFVGLLPTLLSAFVVLLIGLALAGTLGALVAKLLKVSKLEALFDKTSLPKRFGERGLKFSLSGLGGWVAKWFLIVVTLIAVADILRWPQVTEFLRSVALYIPNVLVAVVILTVGFILGRYLHQLVERSVRASRLAPTVAGSAGAVTEWAVAIFGILAALAQLGIATRLIEILFGGFVTALAIAFGLAFGLGGRDKAHEWLDRVTRELSGK